MTTPLTWWIRVLAASARAARPILGSARGRGEIRGVAEHSPRKPTAVPWDRFEKDVPRSSRGLSGGIVDAAQRASRAYRTPRRLLSPAGKEPRGPADNVVLHHHLAGEA